MMFDRFRFRRAGGILLVALLFLGGRYDVHGKELHLFSAVSGTITDAAGRFRFPEVTVRNVLAGLIPHQPLVEQTITIRQGGREYLAWEHARNSYLPTDELGGIALDFTCDLGNDPGYQLVNHREKLGYAGICRLRRE